MEIQLAALAGRDLTRSLNFIIISVWPLESQSDLKSDYALQSANELIVFLCVSTCDNDWVKVSI